MMKTIFKHPPGFRANIETAPCLKAHPGGASFEPIFITRQLRKCGVNGN